MVDLEVSLEGTRVDVGETIHCSGEGCDSRFYEGAPVTVIAVRAVAGGTSSTCSVRTVRPTSLDGYERRDSEGVAVAEGELAVVLSDEQAWLVLVRLGVLSGGSPVEGLLGVN